MAAVDLVDYTAVYSFGHIAGHLPDYIVVHSQVGCMIVEYSWEGIRKVVEQTFVARGDNSELDRLEPGIQELGKLESIGLGPDTPGPDMLGSVVEVAAVDKDLEALVSHDMA